MSNGSDFTIAIKNVDTLPHSTRIIDQIHRAISPIVERAGKKLKIRIDRGIQSWKSDVDLEFDRTPMFTGPGTSSAYGNAEGKRATVYVDNHHQQRLGGGVRVRPFNKGRDYTSRVESLFERKNYRLADFLANTSIEEIGHILLRSPDHSSDPGNAMCPSIPRRARDTTSRAIRAWAEPRTFNTTQQQRIIQNLRASTIGIPSSIKNYGPNSPQARAANLRIRQRNFGVGATTGPRTNQLRKQRQVGKLMLDQFKAGGDPYRPEFGSFNNRDRRRYNTYMQVGINPLSPGRDSWSKKPYAFAGDMKPHEPLNPNKHWVFEPEIIRRSSAGGAFRQFGL